MLAGVRSQGLGAGNGIWTALVMVSAQRKKPAGAGFLLFSLYKFIMAVFDGFCARDFGL
jgi:hypothetical protein